ncbi:hypothetical protein ACN2WE_21310 [Streptomyces sp. cg28]|uniref:hypothetical protein n=1 Tax=Streptomyces sp. cg28 TaxID=3403457 RepID=UPI003B212D46
MTETTLTIRDPRTSDSLTLVAEYGTDGAATQPEVYLRNPADGPDGTGVFLDPLGLDVAIAHLSTFIHDLRVMRSRIGETKPEPTVPGTVACRTYPQLCDQTGPHDDHSRHHHGIVATGFVHLTEGTPSLYIGVDEFDPTGAEDKALALEAEADHIRYMAEQVRVGQALARLRTARAAAPSAFAEVLDIIESAILEGHDPVDVGERVQELVAQVRAKRAAA